MPGLAAISTLVPKLATDICVCGHTRADHIYHVGACRPGFVCEAGCTAFVRRPADVVAAFEKSAFAETARQLGEVMSMSGHAVDDLRDRIRRFGLMVGHRRPPVPVKPCQRRRYSRG